MEVNRLRNEKGFSLIEVLIALTIMMGTLTVLAMAWSTSQLRLRKMRLNHQAAFLLDYKVADIEREYKDQFTLLPDEDSGDFTDLGKEYKNFTWTLSSQKFELPDLTPLIIQYGGAQGGDALLITMMNQLGEFFNQAMKEATITIVYKFGKNDVKYSATIFLIDYNQQLPLPTAPAAGP